MPHTAYAPDKAFLDTLAEEISALKSLKGQK